MDLRARVDDFDELLATVVDAVQAKIHTAIPVKLSEDSEDGHTVKLQPLIKWTQRLPDGTQKFIELPVISDIPIHHHSGGGVTITHPHKKDDEGIFLVASRAIDIWHEKGDVQPQADTRMHSLSDGFYIPGVRSTPRKLKNVSKTSTQMRSDDGKHVFDMHPKDGPSMSADDGKHVVSAHPKNGVSITTAKKLAIKADKGLDVKGDTHFLDKVTSNKSIGAPSLRGIVSNFAGGIMGALLCFAALAALDAARPRDGMSVARYALAALRSR